MLSIPNFTKGLFNNNVDQILHKFTTHLNKVDIVDVLCNMYLFHQTKHRFSTDPLTLALKGC